MTKEQMKPEGSPVVNEEVKAKAAGNVAVDDFSAPDCCVEDTGSCDCKVKKYGALALAVILFLGLFAGILMRADAVLNEVTAIREEVLAAVEASETRSAALEALVAEASANLAELDAKIAKTAAIGDETSAALEEIRALYKETSGALREALVAKDQLIRELVGSVRPAAPAAE